MTAVDDRLRQFTRRREPCVCDGPEIVSASYLAGDVMEAVQRHQVEPCHIAYDQARGIPLSAPQLEAIALDRELVGAGSWR